MPTPSLRILIAEGEHLQRLAIEKIFNKYGYHRISPVGSFEELIGIIEYAIEPFDLVVINIALIPDVGGCLEDFCLQYSCIRNALIYEGEPCFIAVDGYKRGGVFKKVAGVPDVAVIGNLMSQIDPRRRKRSITSLLR